MIVKKVRPGEDAATNTRDACATLNRLLIVGQLVLSLNVISTLAAEAAEASFRFAGVPFSPGSAVRANVPLSAEEKSYSGQGGNPVPQSEVADGLCRLLRRSEGAGSIAPLLARSGCRITGIYLTGVNEDYLSGGYARSQPGTNFLSTPIYVSAGHDDRIARLEQQYDVVGSIKRTGFQRLRIGTFRGGHEVNDAQTSIALRWFRALQK